MEVLNLNRRRSAYGRIIVLTAVTLVLLMLVMYSMYDKYISQGLGEIEKMQKEHSKVQKNALKAEAGLKDDIKILASKLEECQDNIMNSRLKSCLDRFEQKEKRRDDLEEELETCENTLEAATDF